MSAETVLQNVYEKLNDIAASLGSLSAHYESLHRELIGDGQPGRVGKLERDVDGIKHRLQYLAGVLSVITSLWIIVSEFVVHRIMRIR